METVKLEPGKLAEIDPFEFQTLLQAILQGNAGMPYTTNMAPKKKEEQQFYFGGYIPEQEMTWEDIYRIIGRN
jgi:hypothetical protein